MVERSVRPPVTAFQSVMDLATGMKLQKGQSSPAHLGGEGRGVLASSIVRLRTRYLQLCSQISSHERFVCEHSCGTQPPTDTRVHLDVYPPTQNTDQLRR